MSISTKLLKVGSLTHSLEVYLPTMILQKALGMTRLILLTRLIDATQWAIWAIGLMIFSLIGPVITLGANHGIARYTSLYEVQDKLAQFYKKAKFIILSLALTFTILIAIGWSQILDLAFIFDHFITQKTSVATTLIDSQISYAIIGNIFMIGIFVCMMSLICAMRLYRLAAVVEIFFTLSFSTCALIWAKFLPDATSILLSHFVSITATIIVGIYFVELAVRKMHSTEVKKQFETEPQYAVPTDLSDEIETSLQAATDPTEVLTKEDRETISPTVAHKTSLLQIMRFSFFSMISTLVWSSVSYIGFIMVFLCWSPEQAGPFDAIQRLCQRVILVANAAWGVLFAHVAKRWESQNQAGAFYILETAFKAISLLVSTLAVVLIILAPIWVKILAKNYQFAQSCVPGIIMFFAVASNLALLTILAKLHEKPIIISLAALAGGAAIIAIGALSLQRNSADSQNFQLAARATGIGMFAGANLVMIIFFKLSKIRIAWNTYFMIALPGLFLLPVKILAPIWIAILLLAIFTNKLFSYQQKQTLLAPIKSRLAKIKFGK